MKSLNKTKFVLAVMILTSSAAMIIARANKMSRENIPLDFIISEWQLVIDPDAGNTRIDSSATVLSGSKHAPTEIPVAPSSIVLGDTKINGKKIVPRIKNGWFVVPVERDGLFTITADIKIKPTEDRGEKNITLAKPQSVVSLVRFDCDDAFEVRIKGERNILEGTETSGTHGEIFFSDKKDLSVTWREARKPADRQSILRVKPSVAWTVREKHLSATAVLDINISEKKLNDLAVNIPEGAENVFAAGRDIKEFKHAGKLVRIYFRGPIEGRTEIRLSFDIPRTKGSVVSCKDITAQNGIAETGGYILLLNDTHELMLENSIAGLKPISYYHLEDRMKGLVEGTPLFVYERQARDITAKFDMIAHSPFPMVGTVADRADVAAVISKSGEEIVKALYRIKNSSQQYLRISMPEGARVISAKVEHKPVRIARDGKYFLMPLAKSIQTLGGEVAFPVEIIYCRQGDAIAEGKTTNIDLPELDSVPVTVVNVTVFRPNDIRADKTHGSLKEVETFSFPSAENLTKGNLLSSQTTDKTSAENILGMNYYNLGYDAYKENRLEDADEYLNKAKAYMTDQDFIKDADNLIGNIKLGRGQTEKLDSSEMRAKAASIQKELSSENVQLKASLDYAIQSGLKNLEAGNEEIAIEMLQEAEDLTRRLGSRSMSQLDTEAVGDKFKKTLQTKREEQITNRKLSEQLADLKTKIKHQAKKDVYWGNRAAGILSDISDEQADVDMDYIQQVVLDNNADAAQSQRTDVDKKVYASRALKKGRSSPSHTAVSQSDKPQESLSSRNKRLEREVQILQQVVNASTDNTAIENKQTDKYFDSFHRRLEETGEKADEILNSLKGRKDGKVNLEDDRITKTKAETLNQWLTVNDNPFNRQDEKAGRRLSELQNKASEIQNKIASFDEDIRRRDVIEIGGIQTGPVISEAEEERLERFIKDNYLTEDPKDQAGFEFNNGVATVTNACRNFEIINDVLTNFGRNNGQAVPLSGRVMPISDISGKFNEWFTNKSPDGRAYGVIDEAQYRTIIATQPADSPSSNNQPASDETKKVIVGSANTVAGESFRISRGGLDYNGIQINGAEIKLPHDMYLTIDNGSYVSIISAGEVADWFDAEMSAPGDQIAMSEYSPSIPITGTPMLFEKTLLVAGESPDMTINWK